MKWPSYVFACQIKKSMPGNMVLIMSDIDKIHAETMFCAYEKSHCIDGEKGCLCATCELFNCMNLGKNTSVCNRWQLGHCQCVGTQLYMQEISEQCY